MVAEINNDYEKADFYWIYFAKIDKSFVQGCEFFEIVFLICEIKQKSDEKKWNYICKIF